MFWFPSQKTSSLQRQTILTKPISEFHFDQLSFDSFDLGYKVGGDLGPQRTLVHYY